MAFAIMAVSCQNFRETVSEVETPLRNDFGINICGKNEESRIEQRRCLNAFTAKVSAYPI